MGLDWTNDENFICLEKSKIKFNNLVDSTINNPNGKLKKYT